MKILDHLTCSFKGQETGNLLGVTLGKWMEEVRNLNIMAVREHPPLCSISLCIRFAFGSPMRKSCQDMCPACKLMSSIWFRKCEYSVASGTRGQQASGAFHNATGLNIALARRHGGMQIKFDWKDGKGFPWIEFGWFCTDFVCCSTSTQGY